MDYKRGLYLGRKVLEFLANDKVFMNLVMDIVVVVFEQRIVLDNLGFQGDGRGHGEDRVKLAGDYLGILPLGPLEVGVGLVGEAGKAERF